jgi:DNA-binding NarL/FixJ family response regulator
MSTPPTRTAPADKCRKLVAIIEDDMDMRLFMQDLLAHSEDLRCLDAYSSAEKALSVIPRRIPQLVLVDIRLPGISGIDCIRRLKAIMPRTPVVAVTGLRDVEMIRQASDAGCEGYLEKPFSRHQFLATLRFCLSHADREEHHQPCGNQRAVHSPRQVLFTERELQVMNCLCRGLLYKEIALELGVSFSLVHKIQNRIFQKLQARNRTEAVNHWQAMIRNKSDSLGPDGSREAWGGNQAEP